MFVPFDFSVFSFVVTLIYSFTESKRRVTLMNCIYSFHYFDLKKLLNLLENLP